MRRGLLVIPLILLVLSGCASGPPVPLATGQVAPDFAAKTLDGETFRLGDQRGKVVVLDFWATWCGPCKAMIPHQREMVKRFAGRPFVMVGISADDKKHPEMVRDFVRDERMTWTHLHDGDDGPIIASYRVGGFPTMYVIDARGIIRYVVHKDSDLERSVEKLLAEIGG